MAKDISIIYTLKDNFSNSLRGISKNQQSFQKELSNASKELAALYDKKRQLKIDNKAADKAIKDTTKNAEKFGDRYKQVMEENARRKLEVKMETDAVNQRIHDTENKLNNLNKKKTKPEVDIKDNATKKLEGISSKLNGIMGLAKAATGLFIGGKIAEGIGKTFEYGAELERQMISMEHFIGVTNKGKSQAQVKSMAKDYLTQVRRNADVTPFQTSDVEAAGTRAITVAGGNTKQAMSILKLAENMAALNPQKTLDDAMAAIAGMKMGQTRRMKEFGFNINAKDLKNAKGDISNVKNSQGISVQQMFKGGAGELASSGFGLISTIKSKLRSGITDAGYKMLEALKPALAGLVPILDQLTPTFEKMGDAMGTGITKAIQFFGGFSSTIKENMPMVRSIIGDVSNWISDKFGWLGTKTGFLKKVFHTAWGGIQEVIKTSWVVIKPYIDYLAALFKLLFNVFQFVFPGIVKIIQTAWSIIKPILELFGKFVGFVAGGVNKLAEWIGSKTSDNKKTSSPPPETTYKPGFNPRQRAFGITRVPYNNYPVLAHEGERLLTKQEASSHRSGSLIIGKLADHIIIREEADIDKITTKLANKLLEASFNMA